MTCKTPRNCSSTPCSTCRDRDASAITNPTPLLSVVILTFNRKDELESQLGRLFRQTRAPDAEVIVVDNHSTDGTDELLSRFAGRVRHLRLPDNAGAVARSEGMKAARGDVVVTLDDDVYLLQDDALDRILRFFEAHPAAAAVNFKVVDDRAHELMPFHWYHPRPHEAWGDKTFETDYISEGAVAFRKSALDRVGFYPEDFFISHEGIDLAWRLIGAGLPVLYTGDVAVVHRYSLRERATWRNAYYNTRNFVWLLVKYVPFPRVLGLLAYRLATAFVFCARAGLVLWWVKAVWDALLGLPRQLRKRRPLSKEAWRRLQEIRRLKPGFAYRVRNFFVRTRLMEEERKQSSGTPR